jgi:hypothetical protein
MKHHKIEWIDSGREPQVAPNPEYPHGIDLNVIDATQPDETPSCTITLPYPARRIGLYLIECSLCGAHVACTTAGRPDDPRSIRIPCKTQ